MKNIRPCQNEQRPSSVSASHRTSACSVLSAALGDGMCVAGGAHRRLSSGRKPPEECPASVWRASMSLSELSCGFVHPQLHCRLDRTHSCACALSNKDVARSLPLQVRAGLLSTFPECCRRFHAGLRGEAAAAPGVRAGALHRRAGPGQSGRPTPSQIDIVRLGAPERGRGRSCSAVLTRGWIVEIGNGLLNQAPQGSFCLAWSSYILYMIRPLP